jgi:hypothetical protein
VPYLIGTVRTPSQIMQCKKGIHLETQQMRVPCGQCMPCRINKGRLWSARILMEWITHGHGYFVTLTYDDENVPVKIDTDGAAVQTLDKKGTLKWLDNWRRRHAPDARYYLVGEYGETTYRPHYHLAVFPHHVSEISSLRTQWTKGFTQLAEMSPARARYLANYTAKKLTKKDDPRLGVREPEFRTSSRNPPLGSAFCETLISYHSQPRQRKLLDERGDVPRAFRVDGKIYPIGDWALTKIRKGLGIPLLHRERCLHPNYEQFHELQEATWEPELAQAMEDAISAKAIQKHHRSKTVNI